MDRLDCVVAGAGVVGLAIARELSLSGREVIVLEAHAGIGMETSSRNSEVIHAGIYYPADSLKSVTCISGKELLYKYCRERHIPFNNCGKLIVATNREQVTKLALIKERALACGMKDLWLLNEKDIYKKEPALNALAALWSPTTGIIDSHTYMVNLQGDIENASGSVVFNSKIESGCLTPSGIGLTLADGFQFKCRTFINATGLGAHDLCRKIAGFPTDHIPQLYMAKGSYFSLIGHCPFSHLIYPVPVPGGLGTHLTLDLAGQGRFGPNVKWVNSIDYNVDPADAEEFYSDIRRYWPDLKEGSLAAGYAGIRPKIVPSGAPASDFVVQGPREHGVNGMVNLFAIESPGLTASLAIAKIVSEII